MKKFSFLLAGIAVLLSASPGFSAARRNLPGCATTSLPAADDFSTGLVPIGFTINFLGSSYSGLYVNNNGNVTFGAPLLGYVPNGMTNGGVPVIMAPFFADVDTTGAGSSVVTYGNATVNGRPAFCVEWNNVGYYSGHADKLNSFELVLIDRSDVSPGSFDFEFNYDNMLWETGDANGGASGFGGTVAQVGFSNGLAGGANNSFIFPGSGISFSLLNNGSRALVVNSLNTSVSGRYLFATRGGTPGPPPPPPPIFSVGAPATTTPVLILTGAMLIAIVAYTRVRLV